MSNFLKEYQDFCRTTAIYAQSVAIQYLTLGLAAEAGEVAGKHAKYLRDSTSADKLREDIKKELGDVCWFVAQLCNYFGWTMEEVMAGNMDKLSSRKERGTLSGSGDTR